MINHYITNVTQWFLYHFANEEKNLEIDNVKMWFNFVYVCLFFHNVNGTVPCVCKYYYNDLISVESVGRNYFSQTTTTTPIHSLFGIETIDSCIFNGDESNFDNIDKLMRYSKLKEPPDRIGQLPYYTNLAGSHSKP